jgi:hypothetical protein
MFPWETLITGVVGLAGIGGTLWQGKRSREAQTADLKASFDATAENLKVGIDAENDRARRAEKRQVYANCISSFGTAINEIARFHTYTEDPKAYPFMEEYARAIGVVLNAVSEVQLIAPPNMMLLARRAYSATFKFADRADEITTFREVRSELLKAMRADLGDPD